MPLPKPTPMGSREGIPPATAARETTAWGQAAARNPPRSPGSLLAASALQLSASLWLLRCSLRAAAALDGVLLLLRRRRQRKLHDAPRSGCGGTSPTRALQAGTGSGELDREAGQRFQRAPHAATVPEPVLHSPRRAAAALAAQLRAAEERAAAEDVAVGAPSGAPGVPPALEAEERIILPLLSGEAEASRTPSPAAFDAAGALLRGPPTAAPRLPRFRPPP